MKVNNYFDQLSFVLRSAKISCGVVTLDMIARISLVTRFIVGLDFLFCLCDGLTLASC